jgi:hypothetical protein
VPRRYSADRSGRFFRDSSINRLTFPRDQGRAELESSGAAAGLAILDQSGQRQE